MIVPKHRSRRLLAFSFVPIKGNRILLFAKYTLASGTNLPVQYLHLSIYEIRSDQRVGAALWSFEETAGSFRMSLKPMKSTENALGISFWMRDRDHWRLFDISTTDTDASGNNPLIESGRIDFNSKLGRDSVGLSEIFIQLCQTCSNAFSKSYYLLTGAFS